MFVFYGSYLGITGPGRVREGDLGEGGHEVGLDLTEEMGPGSVGCGAHGFISNLTSYFLCYCRVSRESDW